MGSSSTHAPAIDGSEIAAILAERKMTQKDLADQIGVHQPTISQVITGKKNLPKVVQKIMVALDLTIPHKNNSHQTDYLSIGKRIALLLDERNITQVEFAATADITPATLSNIITGKSKTTKYLSQIAEALGVERCWLEKGVTLSKVAVTPKRIKLIHNFDNYINTKDRFISLPSELLLDPYLKPKDSLDHDLFYLVVPDKGVEQVFKENAVVFIDIDKTDLFDGYFYVIEYGGLICIRELFHAPYGGIRIIHRSNNTEYRNFTIAHDDISSIKILGKVVSAYL